jgi:hypothetical protein
MMMAHRGHDAAPKRGFKSRDQFLEGQKTINLGGGDDLHRISADR